MSRSECLHGVSSCDLARKSPAPKVLFLEPQPCIRALKYAVGLRCYFRDGISLWFGYFGQPLQRLYGFGGEYFDRAIRLDPEEPSIDMRRIVTDYKPSLIHGHNAPDTLTLTAIEVSGPVPVIHDVHEILSTHDSGFFADDDEEKFEQYREVEKMVCEKSDGLIYPSEGVKRYIEQRYDVDPEHGMVFYNYVLGSSMPRVFKKKLSDEDGEMHAVYIGCVTSVIDGSHYDLREIFRRIADHGIHMHIYPTSDLVTRSNEAYRDLASSNRFVHYHGTLDYRRLLCEITQYDFGWAGFNGEKNRSHLDAALPNKVFDYVGSGLPVIAFPHETIQQFIEKYGLGIVVGDVDELPEILRDVSIPELGERVARSRHRFTVESNIPKLVDFYKRVVDLRNE